MKYKELRITVAVFLALTSCETKHLEAETTTKDATGAAQAVPANIAIIQESNLDLLQGKWQHVEDSTNFLIFDKDHRKEIAAGMDEWDDDEFILSSKCQSETVPESEEEKDRYISLVGDDMCWYIVDIDSSILSLSYVGRGNTLTYRKVNQ